MITMTFNQLRELDAYVNEHGIEKEDIISIFQNNENLYVLMYYDH